jgi:hypothetical protein
MSNRDFSPVAIVLRTIKLRDGVAEDTFEKFMLEELFPNVQTGSENEPDQHLLLRGGSRDEYVWMSRLTYAIHQTPLPVWLLDRVKEMYDGVREKVERFGTQTLSEVYYDVAAWRRRLGG